MQSKLLERIDAIQETLGRIEAKAKGKNAAKLDPLILAKTLIAVDGMTSRLSKLEEQLQAGLFEHESA